MVKKQTHIRSSALTDGQIGDLATWWNSTITGTIQECVSRAWHIEHARRMAGRDPVWIVRPTGDLFPDEASAIRWLEEDQGAVRTGLSEWVTVDEDGDRETEWALAIAPFTV